MRSLEDSFQGVGDWCERTGKGGGFPTGERGPSASPYVWVYRLIELGSSVVEQRVVPVVDLGLDLAHPDPTWAPWRQGFTAANAYAHSQGFFHAFPDYRRVSSTLGVKLRLNLIKELPGNGVSWQDVPAADIFPSSAPLPVESFVNHEGLDWMLYTNLWARNHTFMAGIPTGWVAQYNSTWVMGVVLFQSQVGTPHFVHGNELFTEEACALEVNPPPNATTTAAGGPGNPLIGVAEPATLAIDESPFDTRLFAVASFVDYFRCYARRTGEARIALMTPDLMEAVLMIVTPRLDGRTLVFFGNQSTAGAWIVAHRLNAAMTQSVGEVASVWRAPGGTPQFAFEVTTGAATSGQIVAHSIGFVKQGTLGVANPIMSFAWSTFLRFAPGMNLTFVWA